MSDVTRILNAIEQGDGQAAERLLTLANNSFRKRTVVLGCAAEGYRRRSQADRYPNIATEIGESPCPRHNGPATDPQFVRVTRTTRPPPRVPLARTGQLSG
jgi:hypothetical protein